MKNLNMVIAGNCCITGEPYSVVVNTGDYFDWQNGKLAQNAFPYLDRGDREWIISRVSPKGWDVLFSKGDEVEA